MKKMPVMEKNWRSPLLQNFKDQPSWVRLIAFSLDGITLASASNDHKVRLWDIFTGKARQTLEGHINEVTAVAFSPYGTMITTNRGRINLKSDDIISSSPPQHSALPALVIKDTWIACNGHNVLWLPPDYTPCISALYATKVAIGYS